MAETVKGWLESLELEQYLATLEEGGYDTLEKCASLTTSDLDRIGMTLPGHQLRILKHLPKADGHLQEADVYDMPSSVRDSQTVSSDEVYGNIEVRAPIRDHSPQRSTPLPQPRKMQKKRPVPAPRTIRKKPPQLITDSTEVNIPTSADSSASEPKGVLAHKPTLKLAGATESDTETDILNCDNCNEKIDSKCINKPVSGEEMGIKTEMNVLPKQFTSDGGNTGSVAVDTENPFQTTVMLTDKDLEFLENFHGPSTSESQMSHDEPLRQVKPNHLGGAASKNPSKSFNAELSDTNKELFELKSSFDVAISIPQSVSEWEKATVRESLVMEPLADKDGGHAEVAVLDNAEPQHNNNVIKPLSVESRQDFCSVPSGVHVLDAGCDSDDNSHVCSKESSAIVVQEEEENRYNEALYVESKYNIQADACQDSPYMSAWNMRSGSRAKPVPRDGPSSVSPPRHSPPPPMPPPHETSLSAQSERNDNLPPALPKRNLPAPPIPERLTTARVTHGTTLTQLPMPTISANRDQPPPDSSDTHKCLAQQRMGSQSPDEKEKEVALLRAKTSAAMMGDQRGSRESFTDLARDRLTPRKSPLTTMSPLPEQPCSPQMLPAPVPPAKPAANQLLDFVDASEQSVEYEDIPASPSVSDDIQSDDTLSDGGDWCDAGNVISKDRLKPAIPVIPAVQNKVTRKCGYLLKKASQETIRKMGGTWTKRWVTLDENYLTYCSVRKHSATKRMIPIESILNIEQSVKSGDTHPFQFCVITVDRIYTFAADNADDLSVWSNILMLNVMGCKKHFVEGGEMNSPDKEGLIKLENVKSKRYFVLKGGKLCYYNTLNDFKAGSPIRQIDMKVTVVKELNRNRLQLVTSTDNIILIMETTDDLISWKNALVDAIAESLGEDSVLNEVYENHSNRFCADCQVSGPQWASINMGITLCKQCAGIHRMLTIPVSKVRSLRMDLAVWKPTLIKMMQVIGNDNANHFWQWNLKHSDYIDADSTMSAREEHIKLKYRTKKFCKLHLLCGDQNALNEALLKAVQYSDVLETMQLLFSGADILSRGPDGQTPLQLAERANQELQVEFLCQNGAEGSGQMPVTTLMVQEQMNAKVSTYISHKGYLFKTGSNVKEDFLKRWCVLDQGYLAYYENEKSVTPKNKIGVKEMMSVTLTSDPRFEFSFELATVRHGRVFLFAAELEEDRKTWVNLLAKALAPLPKELLCNVRDFHRAGVVYMKKSSSENWSKHWLQQKERLLFCHFENHGAFEKIDLRKVKNIKLICNQSETCKNVYEEGPMIILNLYKDRSRTYNTLYIQGDIAKETEAWHGLLQTLTKKCGLTINDHPLTDEDVPVIVDQCINFVTLHGMKTCGIYRLNGQHSKVTKLLEGFQKDAREQLLRLEEYNVHDVATVLKRFFRTLEEPLLLETLYPKWLNTASIAEPGLKLEWYCYLVRELPFVNYSTLKKLILHLRRVADLESENKMSTTNIASIFGPIVMRVDKDSVESSAGFATTSQEIAVFRDLMEASVSVFEVGDQELELENRMQAVQKMMEETMKKSTEKSKSLSQEMLLPIYMYGKDGRVFTMKVTSSTTAAELLEQVLQKCAFKPSRKTAIFECICSEELERPLHHTEKVLAVTLCWANWPQELSKDNMLCVKDNYVYENIELIFDPHTALFSELKYSEKKGFKKYCFEFSHMQMSYKKDSRATSSLCCWNIEDLTVYVGVQQKRNPPTNWGFSFIKKDEKVQGSIFGHSVCCNTKEELYRWLAAILHSQNIGPPRRIGTSSNDAAGPQNDASLAAVESDSPVASQRNKKLKNLILNKLMHK